MFGPTVKLSGVKLSKDLWERVKRVSDAAGYTSPEEFIQHIVEREVTKLESTGSNAALLEKLKGLGYLE
jgi:metal-responsive CopG/Arc/MetJ family transcriptional regulator